MNHTGHGVTTLQKETRSNCSSGWTPITKACGGTQMGLITRNKMDLTEKALLENTIAENEKLKAMLDYNIMMGNIEDPDAEEEDEEDE